MDLDYHYGAMYVLSRWGKFGSANAQIIATSCQLVDDNFDENPLSDASEDEELARGITVRYSSQNVVGNVTGKGNKEIWMPFHFLPGLEGETDEEKLTCRKNSVLVQKLADRILETTLDNSDFGFRIGIGLHAYADTWAYQGFSGLKDSINTGQRQLLMKEGARMGKAVGDFVEGNETLKNIASTVSAQASNLSKAIGDFVQGNETLGNLADTVNAQKDKLGKAVGEMVEGNETLSKVAGTVGEAAAGFDAKRLWWRSKDGTKNWEEFLEASDKTYRIIQSVSCEPVTGLTDRQKELLLDCFESIQSEDAEERYNEWLKRIHENFFEIEDFDDNDASAEYRPGTILGDENFRGQFYKELNDHFDWVRKELIEAGLDVLESEPVY
ncbi:DUF6765 family protein [Selenomonas sp. KH1T6]|uniref:DUF6765 family protein n=1 Tax=Selenomonas sp. KH1T6 TaxID=3158784 RepID=UPI0008A7675B|nr:hypothetical protein SAMN05216583_1161 [Selenomonas ruminantium]